MLELLSRLYLIIDPIKDLKGNELNSNKEYMDKIESYITIRKLMHEKLNLRGCSTISTMSNFYKTTDNSSTLSIAFLCPTHARVMLRQP